MRNAGLFAIAGLAAISARADAGVLLDTADVNDETVVNPTGASNGFGVAIAARQDEMVGRIEVRVHALDLDGDGQPDPTWDDDGNGTLDRAVGKIVVIDLGPTPPDLTSLDTSVAPGSIAYISPSPVPLTL